VTLKRCKLNCRDHSLILVMLNSCSDKVMYPFLVIITFPLYHLSNFVAELYLLVFD